MSQSRLFNIPKSKENDEKYAGWYRYGRLNQAALRVGNSNCELMGEIRFNENSKVFEGFNGTEWKILDSSRGEKGDPGRDFNQIVKFENKNESSSKYIDTNKGEVISPVLIDTTVSNETIINTRNLVSGSIMLNNKEYDSITIKQNESNILLKSNSQPHIWDLTNNIDSIENLKSECSNGDLKCWGNMIKLKVGRESIMKGSFVQLINNGEYLTVGPIKYREDKTPNFFTEPINPIGVALNNCKNGEICKVCTNGITMVRVSNEGGYLQTDNNIMDSNIGIINFEGKAVKTNRRPLQGWLKGGRFLENHVIQKNNLVLFNINIEIMD